MPWIRWYCQLLWPWRDTTSRYSSVQKVHTRTLMTSYKSSSKHVIHYESTNPSSSNNPKWGTVQRIKNIAGTCAYTHTRTQLNQLPLCCTSTHATCACTVPKWPWKLVRPKPDQPDCLLRPWISTIETWENSAKMSIFKVGVTGNQCTEYTWDVEPHS